MGENGSMTEWYRYKLKDQIPDLIDKWKYIVGVEVNDWSIKKMKTRWGPVIGKIKEFGLILN